MKWGNPADIRKKLLKRWETGTLIRELASDKIGFPCREPLKSPAAAEIRNSFDEVREWIRTLDEVCLKEHCELERKEINHRELGRNSLPSALIFSGKEDLLAFIGKKKVYAEYLRLSRELITVFPDLKEWTLHKPLILLENAPVLDRLIRVISWINDHPRPGIYIRQLSLEGVDTKFMEQHRGILIQLLDLVLENGSLNVNCKGVKNFERRYGFLARPELIRFRFTEADRNIGGLSDLTVRADEFCRMDPDIETVFVVENDISALAFPPVPGAMVLFGRGYYFDSIRDAGWLNRKKLYYWGDLDTHGFAILGQFRDLFPHTQSILMDHETLLAHRLHWGREEKQAVIIPDMLTLEEKSLMTDLMDNRYGVNLRLEQEFIPFSYVEKVLKRFS